MGVNEMPNGKSHQECTSEYITYINTKMNINVRNKPSRA